MDEWLTQAKKALEWFISLMGEAEWQRRRYNVVRYFQSLKEETLSVPPSFTKEGMNKFNPVAFYDDWISWYMYLLESVFLRQGCDDPFQSARIYPFFSVIGRYIDGLKKMPGIEERMKTLFNESRNQPDSCLYELCVAVLYLRNGWSVSFVPESKREKMPDLVIQRGEETFWVECKRLAKVSEYAESERTEWQIRMLHLFTAMQYLQVNAYVEVEFKVPIEKTDPVVLGAAITYYVRNSMINKGEFLENSEIRLKAHDLNLALINQELINNSIRPNSPLMIKFLTGDYNIHGNYAHHLVPALLEVVNPDDPLSVLNEFYAELKFAAVVQWDCLAEESIDRKAKDIKKILSKAIQQIPREGKGIVHIGYETVVGPRVELRRHAKIRETISSFYFGNVHIEAIFCNAIQPLTKVDGFECAETTINFETRNIPLLENNLLFDQPGTEYEDTTHWEQDWANR
jgi:Holliday junction resolvase